MYKFIRYEIKYWLKTPMLWIFLFINTLLVFFACATDSVQIGGSVGNIHKNAPFIVQTFYSVMSIVCLLMTTSFMNATANRDFEYNMYQFIFTSPIKKRDYFFGKFIGASMIAVVPMLGVSLGAILAPILSPAFGFAPAERFGPVIWSGHFNGLLAFGIPNVIIAGVFLFSLAMIFRSAIVSFIGSMLLLVIYGFAQDYTRDIQKEWLASLLDPFGNTSFSIMTKYMTVVEKNTLSVALHGDFLINRMLWLGIGFLILIAVYFRFSFNARKEKVKKVRASASVPAPLLQTSIFQPAKAGRFSLKIFLNLIKFETKSVIKNPTYIIIMLIGLITLIINLATVTSTYGTKRYPVTYMIIDTIEGSFNAFLIGFIAFYTGVLVWKERDAKLNEIQDATAVPSGMLFVSKLIAIVLSIAIVFAASIVFGMAAQTAYGYTRYEFGVYVKSLLVIRLSGLIFLTVLSLLFHYLINNRYIAYFAFVAFIIVNAFVWNIFEINSNMLAFGNRPDITYSDMNGFGPFVAGTIWFSLYWTLFCLVICFVISLFFIRGKEPQLRYRWQSARSRFSTQKLAIAAGLLIFIICGSFVFYNTKIINHYDTYGEQESKQVEYEKKYKKYEHLNQPRFYKFDFTIDLRPEDRSMTAKTVAWARNISPGPITEIHFTLPYQIDSIKIDIPKSTIKFNDKRLLYRIYKLNQPLNPGDSIKINIDVWKLSNGFENEVSFTQLTQNGSFFNNSDFLPTFGYNKDLEITDKNKRVKKQLPVRERMPKLNDSNIEARSDTYISHDSDWVNVNTTISTSPGQIAIAPGSLIKSWDAGGRKYFNYRLDQKALNFYSFISGKYEVARKKWNGIDLEVYYDKQHAYNVPNMLNSMQKSLGYYTAHFGPYYQKQCRIIEFPRYASFAQAFPGTMPYSESIGFITDLRNVAEKDIDMVFYVVAHEMGHQYWAHQICGANMQGSEMMSEGFAQYSALMVMEKEYGRDRMKKFLKYEMDDYLNGRSQEPEAERPLMKTESQQYIHYNKASVILYYLKEMIGEQNVNQAMKSLIDKYAYKDPPYATSNDAVREFRKVTPDSLQYLISDMFEKITVFDNRITEAKIQKKGSEYEVTLKTLSEKFYADSLGRETRVPMHDFIDVAIFAEPKDNQETGKALVRKRLQILKKNNTFTFKTSELPYQAGIDPYNYLIDRVPDDNIRKVE